MSIERMLVPMNFVNSPFPFIFSLALTSSFAMADTMPTEIVCTSSNAISAHLSVQAEAWISLDDQFQPTCPLLETKNLRKLVDKFGEGTTFAHPVIPYTCLSGTVTSGTLQLDNDVGSEIQIDHTASYSESAQRLFPAPISQGGFNLFAISVDRSLQVGAAMTAIHLEGWDSQGENYEFDLLLDDHFLLTEAGEDTEDFLIVGSKGDYKVSGRLTGRGQIINSQLLGVVFEITGSVCLK